MPCASCWRSSARGDGFNTILAWAYVGLRVAHSIVQATINRVIIRFRALCPVIAGADGADPARRVWRCSRPARKAADYSAALHFGFGSRMGAARRR